METSSFHDILVEASRKLTEWEENMAGVEEMVYSLTVRWRKALQMKSRLPLAYNCDFYLSFVFIFFYLSLDLKFDFKCFIVCFEILKIRMMFVN